MGKAEAMGKKEKDAGTTERMRARRSTVAEYRDSLRGVSNNSDGGKRRGFEAWVRLVRQKAEDMDAQEVRQRIFALLAETEALKVYEPEKLVSLLVERSGKTRDPFVAAMLGKLPENEEGYPTDLPSCLKEYRRPKKRMLEEGLIQSSGRGKAEDTPPPSGRASPSNGEGDDGQPRQKRSHVAVEAQEIPDSGEGDAETKRNEDDCRMFEELRGKLRAAEAQASSQGFSSELVQGLFSEGAQQMFHTLLDDELLTLCRLAWNAIPNYNESIVARGLFLKRIRDLSQPASRALNEALCSLMQLRARLVITEILLPLITTEGGKSFGPPQVGVVQVCLSDVDGCREEDVELFLSYIVLGLEKLVCSHWDTSTSQDNPSEDLGESIVLVLQHVLDLKTIKKQKAIDDLRVCIETVASLCPPESIKLVKVISSLCKYHGKALSSSGRTGTLICILEKTKTILTRATLKLVRKI